RRGRAGGGCAAPAWRPAQPPGGRVGVGRGVFDPGPPSWLPPPNGPPPPPPVAVLAVPAVVAVIAVVAVAGGGLGDGGLAAVAPGDGRVVRPVVLVAVAERGQVEPGRHAGAGVLHGDGAPGLGGVGGVPRG